MCPFEAITRDAETCKVEIDNQKCQVCGICYSACPVTAIEIAYYDYNHLIDYVNCERKNVKADTLVMMCRGNSPSSGEMADILKEQGLNVKKLYPATSALRRQNPNRLRLQRFKFWHKKHRFRPV